MAKQDAYLEEINSQIPALQLLMNLGWQYLPPDEALSLRNGSEREVVLWQILDNWLRENNQVERRGKFYPFSDGNIKEALRKLDEPFQSLIVTNEKIYDLLTLGTSLSETIEGDRKSYSLHYIDWQHPENNVYHVTDEFTVQKRGSSAKRRPDIVLFVNGIPLVVIENKRPDLDANGEKPTAEAISQMLRNQQDDEIPQLFSYSQILIALAGNHAMYATTGTPKKFWSLWEEEADMEEYLVTVTNTPLSPDQKADLYDHRYNARKVRRHFDELGDRLLTMQDRLIYSLLHPERLMELVYQYLVYDNGVKKIARYQQYFAVKETVNRVAHINAQGTRTGGVIWHTTGSGKSLTMVMLAKALSLAPSVSNPRLVMVTDRVNLDDQIYKTFAACGKNVTQADSGAELVKLVQNENADIITTVINKFNGAAEKGIKDESHNIFVLVDESHRTQYGSMHARMKRVFPNACYIGFTGTPLTKNEKSTAKRFGGFIHKYPMQQAVQDGAVVPLLYEGRIVEQDVDQAQLEKWFERTTQDMTDEQRADLKRKMSRSDAINTTEQRIREVAWNIANHYKKNFRGDGFKAQLATSSRQVAIKYHAYLMQNGIDAAVIMSPPDTREGHGEVDALEKPIVQEFWTKMMNRYQTEETYNREVLASFSKPDGVEIIVVIDKLLTGFDEPRNTVLYIDKPLKEHTLLQAIARVNRLFEGKKFGYIIDYWGVLGQLNEAMDTYDALAEYDVEDIQGTFTDVSEQLKLLPQYHSDLWAVFNTVSNKKDTEAMERFLEAEDRRNHFYEMLTQFASTLKVALATAQFYEDTPEKRINVYKDDLRFFHRLRQSVKLRYAEAIDYREYEDSVRKLLDEHVKAKDIETITQLVDIFDEDAFESEIERLVDPKAKADTILNRMKRTINERMDEDPAFYRRFSEMIAETIALYKQGRIDELEMLKIAQDTKHQMREGKLGDQPDVLRRYQHAPAYYGILIDEYRLTDRGASPDQAAMIAIDIEALIEDAAVRDWHDNLDVEKQIKKKIDEYLFRAKRDLDLDLSFDDLDNIIERIISIAKARTS